MGFPNFKTVCFCVRGIHRSATMKIVGDITSKANRVLLGHCSNCKIQKYMTVSNNTKAAEVLRYFFKNLGKKDLIYEKRWQRLFRKNVEELCSLEQMLVLQLHLKA